MMQGTYHKNIWKGKIPAKIKIFLLLMTNDAILTKDNLLKRNWKGDPTCYFCNYTEDISHLFFQCCVAKTIWAVVAKCFGANTIPRNLNQCWQWCNKWLPFDKKYHVWGVAAVCWAIWKAHNKACFDKKKIINSPLDIINVCAYAEPDRDQLLEGVNTMLRVAEKILKRQKDDMEGAKRVKDGSSDGGGNTSAW